MPATTYAPTGVARAPSPANPSIGNTACLPLPLQKAEICLSPFAPEDHWCCRLLLAIWFSNTACGKAVSPPAFCGRRVKPGRGPPAPRHAFVYTPVVVMPDHVHLLLFPLRDSDGWPFAMVDILQCLKGTTAHRINMFLHHSGPVWEEESFDHVLDRTRA